MNLNRIRTMDATEPESQYLVQESDLTDGQRLKIKARAAQDALGAFNDELMRLGSDDEFFEQTFRTRIALNLWYQDFERNGGFR
jgi:hypothetical protein